MNKFRRSIIRILAVIIMCSIFPGVSDAAWQWHSPLPEQETLNSIWGSSEDDLFAVGNAGRIFHHEGDHWKKMTSGTSSQLESVWGSSESNVFAVGYHGTILHYDGSVWTEMSSPTSNSLSCVWGSAENDVFAVGFGTILHYDGNAWTAMISGTLNSFYGIWGNTGEDVFAVGYDGIIFHYDGEDWTQMSGGSSAWLESVWGSSGSDVFAVGGSSGHGDESGTMLHYNGEEWTEITDAPFSTTNLYDIWGSSENDIFAVGGYNKGGRVFHYDGSLWTELTSPTANSLYGVWGSSEDDVFAAGYSGTLISYEPGEDYRLAEDLRIRALIDTEEKGPVNAIWQKGGEDTTAAGDHVIWGYFYASPNDVSWGSRQNPDLFAKIWFDHSGRTDVNYFHVSVPDISVYSDNPDDGLPESQSTANMTRRYIRHWYQDGEGGTEGNDEDGNPPEGDAPAGNPSGYLTLNDLKIGAIINTEEKGPIEALWHQGGEDSTRRGDQVVWGLFYASQDEVTWGSENNPDLFVKIWFDVSGRVDVNYFHVSVPDIEIYSDLPNEGDYEQKGTTIMTNRYIRHGYQL